jgi:hypothetical protein
MKWSNVVMVCYGLNDDYIRKTASAWQQRYDINKRNCFYFNDSKERLGCYHGFTLGGPDCLTRIVKSTTKVIVIGYSFPSGYHAESFAEMIKCIGADKAGLLALKCCEFGDGFFLEQLKLLLPKISWFIAPTGYSSPGEYKSIVHQALELHLKRTDLELHGYGSKLSDKYRVKVVKGFGGYLPIGKSERYRAKKGGCSVM